MDRISVIVPVYNTEEKYLRQCIESIVEQEYKDIELILVDDGSTNGAAEVCDRYAEKYDRIQVIHQENQGVSAARNHGMERAEGEWLAFVDADDWLEKNNFSLVMERIEGKPPDMVVWNMYMNYPETQKICKNHKESVYLEGNDLNRMRLRMLRMIPIDRDEKNIVTIGYPFCHLYRREIIQRESVKFDPQFKQGEDKLFNYQYCTAIHNMMYLNYPLYHYRQYDESVSQRFFAEHIDNTTRILGRYCEIEPRIMTDKQYKDAYNIRTSYLAWWLIRKYYLHKDSIVKNPLKEYKQMMRSKPYKDAVKSLYVSEMKNSLTKLRLIMLKLHMYRLLFWDAKLEMKIQRKGK